MHCGNSAINNLMLSLQLIIMTDCDKHLAVTWLAAVIMAMVVPIGCFDQGCVVWCNTN